jgi:ABC-type lipoprotein export system ATPase subunit
MIKVERLSKRFGPVTAVDDLSFTVRPGWVTGFLGPNGAGKTTTMRIILGLAAPTSGRALVGGRRYDGLIRPLREVGSLLDATALHAGRTAWAHLWSIAQANGITRQRVTAVLGLTGLESVARRRVGGFSLGMKQRLGIAAALLGDPPVLMFDEPVNSLDPRVSTGSAGPDRGRLRGRLRVHEHARPRAAPRPAAARSHQPGVRGDRDQRAGRTGVQRRVQHRADPCHVHRGAAPPRGAGRQGGRARRGDAGRRRGGRLRLVRAGPGILADHGQGVSLGHPGVPGAVLCAGLLLCVCALLGVALGAIIRHTSGGIAATIAVILVPGIAALLPAPWNGRIGRFTLLEAAQQVSALHPAADLFSPGWSLLVLLAWPAAGLAAAAILITRRDA